MMMKRLFSKYSLCFVVMLMGMMMPDEMLAQTDWTGSTLSELSEASYPCYLYNPAAKAFLNNGGKWGTQVVLNKDYGIRIDALTNNGQTYQIQTGLNSAQGKIIGYVSSGAAEDLGMYCDRGGDNGGAEMNMTFTPVEGSSNNEYFITFLKDGKIYYLTASGDNEGDEVENTEDRSEYSKWIIVSFVTIKEKLQTSPAALDNPVNITYVIDDANLDRGSTKSDMWIANLSTVGNGAGLKMGVQYRCGTSTEVNRDYTYTPNPQGDNANKYTREHGKYYGAEVRGASGTFSQSIKVYYTGWYEVSCQGFSWNEGKGKNEVASLYAKYGTDNNSVLLASANNGGATVPANWDDATVKLFEKNTYKNSVMIYVNTGSSALFGYTADGVNVEIGIYFDAQKAEASDWTVFDDFQIRFLGDSNELLLFEDNLDHDYILNTEDTYKNVTLLLNRTFTENKWNSLVLPVDLNKGQFVTAFGPNARAAKLTYVDKGNLHFETIAKNGKSDDAAFFEANTPYIVYIESNPKNEAQIEVPLKLSNGKVVNPIDGKIEVSGDMVKVKMGGERKYYNIPYVTLNDKDYLKGENGIFAAIDHNVNNAFIDCHDSGCSIVFSGTYEKTYIGSEIRGDYPDMVGNVIFRGGNLYHITEPYGMKAYRAYFVAEGYEARTDTGDTEEGGVGGDLDPTKLTITIDEVEESETAIFDIFAAHNCTNKVSSGVYNVHGQMINTTGSTAGLAKGVYVINGKTCVVK